MRSGALRRRFQHGDADGRRSDTYETLGYGGLKEPLLGNRDYDFKAPVPERSLEDIWDEERRNEEDICDEERRKEHYWRFLFSNLIAQWAQWIGSIVFQSGSFIARILPLSSNTLNGPGRRLLAPVLSPLQEERLRHLQQRVRVPFDGSRVEHQDALKQLWRSAFPERELPSLKSVLWKEMGWQGPDPSTDFRGGGFISLENLIYFANKYPESFRRLLHKQNGTRAEWEYPFAIAGINISFMLVQMLELQSGNPSSMAGTRFLELLAEDEMAFDNLYCVAFQLMDEQWLVKRASYMQFNDVLKSTRTQLEHELSLEDVSSVKDLPAYNLMRR